MTDLFLDESILKLEQIYRFFDFVTFFHQIKEILIFL